MLFLQVHMIKNILTEFVKNCIAYGPGILELAHQPDEFILISDMLDSAKIRP